MSSPCVFVLKINFKRAFPLTDAPPQPNALPNSVIRTDQPTQELTLNQKPSKMTSFTADYPKPAPLAVMYSSQGHKRQNSTPSI